MSTTPDDEIGVRKARHLDICADPSRFQIESGSTRLGEAKLLVRSLTCIDLSSLDLSTRFLGARISLPILISCMTGGTDDSGRLNRALAEAAEERRVPVGMGSIRALLRDPSRIDQFALKKWARHVPVLANIGAVQLRELGVEPILELVARLEADALVVHLNTAQELMQPEGDRDFSRVTDDIGRVCAASTLPVIVKETGFGMRPSEIDALFGLGASHVDIAGSGGTNWMLVESYRGTAKERGLAADFAGWGLPTGLILAALMLRRRDAGGRNPASVSGEESRVIASGGIRTGADVAVALALGASICGMALPLIRAARAGGVAAILGVFDEVERSLRIAMSLSGARDIAALGNTPVLFSSELERSARLLLESDGSR